MQYLKSMKFRSCTHPLCPDYILLAFLDCIFQEKIQFIYITLCNSCNKNFIAHLIEEGDFCSCLSLPEAAISCSMRT